MNCILFFPNLIKYNLNIQFNLIYICLTMFNIKIMFSLIYVNLTTFSL